MERNSNSSAAQPEPWKGPQLGTRGPGSIPSDPDPFGDNDVDTERSRICQYSSASTGKTYLFDIFEQDIIGYFFFQVQMSHPPPPRNTQPRNEAAFGGGPPNNPGPGNQNPQG
jgi:hypothetical protein